MKIEDIGIRITDTNKLTVSCKGEDGITYAFYIYKNDEIIARFNYKPSSTLNYWISESGTYKAKVFAMDSAGNKVSAYSDEIGFDAEKVFGIDHSVKKEKPALSIIADTLRVIFLNLHIILRMAQFDYRLENKDTYLGRVWEVLTPLIEIGTYWLVFGIGLRKGRDVDGFPYLVWMLVGLVPWFFIKDAILSGMNSIFAKAGLVTKMKFPIAVIPISKILQELFRFLVSLIIMVIILVAYGIYPSVYWLNAVFYLGYAFIFLASLSMVTSVFTMVARDTYKLVSSLIRMLFYLTPILWQMNNMPQFYKRIMKFSPIYYVINGFRESILYARPFWHHYKLIWVMMAGAAVLFCIGCILQHKFKSKFIDLL